MLQRTRLLVFATALCAAASAQDLLLRGEFCQQRGWNSNSVNPRLLADVNGDGKRDIIGFANDGVWVSVFGSSWVPARPTKWLTGYAVNAGNWANTDKFPRRAADVNGDGLADIVGFANDGVYVSLSSGKNFSAPSRWAALFGVDQGWLSDNLTPRFVGDVNGDSKSDVVGFANDGVYVALSTGAGFGALTKVSSEFTPNKGFADQDHFPRMLGDPNGDGVADLIGFAGNLTWVSLSNKTSFATAANWGAHYPSSADKSTNIEPKMIADVNADGKGDLIAMQRDGIYVGLSNGAGFATPTRWTDRMTVLGGGWTEQNRFPRHLGDFDGDGLADLVGFAADGVYAARNTGRGSFAAPLPPPSASGYSAPVTMTATLVFDPPPPAMDLTNYLLVMPPAPPPEPPQPLPNLILGVDFPFKNGPDDRSIRWWDDRGRKATVGCYKNCPPTFADYQGKPVLDSTKTMVCPGYVNPRPHGLRRTGTPFLSTHDNACYACPVSDSDGNILITEADGVDSTPESAAARNTALKSGWNIYGGPVCKVTVKANGRPSIRNPGLGGMAAIAVLQERKIFENPDALTLAIDQIGKAKNLPNYNSRAYVEREWQALANDPLNHEVVRAIMGNILLDAASKTNRTPAEQALVTDMQNFIRIVKIRSAVSALDIYRSWKAHSDQWLASTKRYAFYDLSPRGEVPPDFASAAIGAAVAGATGLSTAGAVGAVVGFSSTILTGVGNMGNLTVGLNAMMYGSNLAKNSIGFVNLGRAALSGASFSGSAGLAMAGPAIIITAATAILSAWVSQWQAIDNAEPSLQTGLAVASVPVDLRAMLNTESGGAEITNYWALAMDVADGQNANVTTLASAAAAAAKANNYAGVQ